MKKLLLAAAVASLGLSANAETMIHKVAMLIDAETVDALTSNQEKTAAQWFVAQYPEGTLITPSTTDLIKAEDFDAIWVNYDRCGIGRGNAPASVNDAVPALKQYLEDGGNLFLSKFATQLITKVGRLPEGYEPNIFGDGDGGAGTDTWTVNAQLGIMNITADPSQYYDHRNHSIYAGMTTNMDFGFEGYALLGTGDEGAMHREDHNCMWDLNAVALTAEGKNTLEQFEKQFNCSVIGTWGHVQDYCVAGVVEFDPAAEGQGRVIANGLAAYEWAPRNGGNAFHSNIEKMTENTLNYLAPERAAINTVEAAAEAEAPVVYYNLQGVRVANPENGLYIRVQGNKASKVAL